MPIQAQVVPLVIPEEVQELLKSVIRRLLRTPPIPERVPAADDRFRTMMMMYVVEQINNSAVTRWLGDIVRYLRGRIQALPDWVIHVQDLVNPVREIDANNYRTVRPRVFFRQRRSRDKENRRPRPY